MSEGDSFFVDTNVLLYALSASEPAKQAIAQTWLDPLWSEQSGRISWQVIHEFYAKAVQKLGVPQIIARHAVDLLQAWKPEPPSHATVQRAWHWCDSAKISFWDALIVAAAEQSGCRYLLSEDFQTGRRFSALTVIDPFQRSPKEFFN